jgi:hypothetical protein
VAAVVSGADLTRGRYGSLPVPDFPTSNPHAVTMPRCFWASLAAPLRRCSPGKEWAKAWLTCRRFPLSVARRDRLRAKHNGGHGSGRSRGRWTVMSELGIRSVRITQRVCLPLRARCVYVYEALPAAAEGCARIGSSHRHEGDETM